MLSEKIVMLWLGHKYMSFGHKWRDNYIMNTFFKIVWLPVYFHFLAESQTWNLEKNLKVFSLEKSMQKWKLEIGLFFFAAKCLREH